MALRKSDGAAETAQLVRVLTATPGDLSSVTGDHVVEETTGSYKLSFDLYGHAVVHGMYPHINAIYILHVLGGGWGLRLVCSWIP